MKTPLTYLALSALLIVSHARAQNAPAPQQLSPAARTDVTAGMNYRLPPDFMTRAAAALQALQGSGIQPPNSTGLSLRDTIAQVATIPGLPPLLSAHGFTPESFVMGMTAFGMTLAATNGQQLPPGIPQPNPANVSLFHAHPDQVTSLMQAMGTPPGQAESPSSTNVQ